MNRHARGPFSFTAVPTDRGRVEFDVDQVGMFTVAFGSTGYPHDGDGWRSRTEGGPTTSCSVATASCPARRSSTGSSFVPSRLDPW